MSIVITSGNKSQMRYVGTSAARCVGVIVHCANGLPGCSVSIAGIEAVGVESIVVKHGMTVVVTAEA